MRRTMQRSAHDLANAALPVAGVAETLRTSRVPFDAARTLADGLTEADSVIRAVARVLDAPSRDGPGRQPTTCRRLWEANAPRLRCALPRQIAVDAGLHGDASEQPFAAPNGTSKAVFWLGVACTVTADPSARSELSAVCGRADDGVVCSLHVQPAARPRASKNDDVEALWRAIDAWAAASRVRLTITTDHERSTAAITFASDRRPPAT